MNKSLKTICVGLFISSILGVANASTVTKTLAVAVNTATGGASATSWAPIPGTNTLVQCLNSDNGDTAYAATEPDKAPGTAGSGNSRFLDMTNFFTSSDIPMAATIDGVQVDIKRCKSLDPAHNSGPARNLTDKVVQLIVGGTASGNDKHLGGDWPIDTYTNQSYGGGADLWGLSLTRSDLIASDFGVRLQVTTAQNSDTDKMYVAKVTYVTITVTYH